MVTGVDIMYNLKKQIADIGKRLADKGLSPGFSGNISVRFGDKILVTPSGYSLGELEADDIVVLDFDFNMIEGDKKPSSSLFLQRIYLHWEIFLLLSIFFRLQMSLLQR